MNAEAVIVPMSGADLDQVLALERSIYPFPWTRGNFTDSLDSGYSAWLARSSERIDGYALMLLAADEAQLLNISVAPARQRAGVGASLFVHLRGVAEAAGSRRMFLEVRRSNAQAQAFYRQRGFQQIGERRGYYPAVDSREDALVMELSL